MVDLCVSAEFDIIMLKSYGEVALKTLNEEVRRLEGQRKALEHVEHVVKAVLDLHEQWLLCFHQAGSQQFFT